MKWIQLLLLVGMATAGCANAQTNTVPKGSPDPDINRTVSEEEYSQVSKRILDRIMALKEVSDAWSDDFGRSL